MMPLQDLMSSLMGAPISSTLFPSESLLPSSISSTSTFPATSTPLSVYSTPLSTMSTLDTDASSTLTPALTSYITSQEKNTSTSPSSSHIPTASTSKTTLTVLTSQTSSTTSTSTSGDSGVITGSTVGAIALLISIAIIALFFCLRARRRNFRAHTRLDPFEHSRPIDSPTNGNHKFGIWRGQRGYDPGQVHNPSRRSDSITVVGTDDLGSLSETADMPRDRFVVARREWWRELKKLNPAQFSELQQTRAREQEGLENRARTGDDALVALLLEKRNPDSG
ncbi:hypothetical protein EDC04DRAFT_157942 [Pisolithus marmoratus]|nr:hypothetical protein EDC04DRAFT_157942 [Pisolithus marmoratus]